MIGSKHRKSEDGVNSVAISNRTAISRREPAKCHSEEPLCSNMQVFLYVSRCVITEGEKITQTTTVNAPDPTRYGAMVG